MKKIFITGGAGYVGSMLTPYLISKGYQVTVYDLMIYGEEVLDKNKNLNLIKGDIRDTGLLQKSLSGHDTVIHLACISNDPSFELNPELGKSINFDAFIPLVELSKASKISRFIYASSSSVYGVKEDKNVIEETFLEPLTDYSKYKADCEEILKKYHDDNFTTTIIRPATVCGYSRRQRLDLVVNILTNLAFHKREIKVLGGRQLRPNIHIQDMIRVYELLINAKKNLIAGQIFNAGYENLSVNEISQKVVKIIGDDVRIFQTDTNDNRSYHINSDKIRKVLGFKPSFTTEDAIKDLKLAFEKKILNEPLTNENFFNIKKMQLLDLK